ncbi:hypothetical protein [Streptomyces lunaelactis]|uniref:hypothetical protein n=1 Tax=Streptomyces lunaelactis TaxID=1535768 RepID=UPI001584A9A8|nr:hypothetical protein [Streptomyces lunaelactis]NUK16063.1 hypothetical protein [Streptomyces lunaelactis]
MSPLERGGDPLVGDRNGDQRQRQLTNDRDDCSERVSNVSLNPFSVPVYNEIKVN